MFDENDVNKFVDAMGDQDHSIAQYYDDFDTVTKAVAHIMSKLEIKDMIVLMSAITLIRNAEFKRGKAMANEEG